MGILWPDYATEERKRGVPWYNQIYGDDAAALFTNVPASEEAADKFLMSGEAAHKFPMTHFHAFFESRLLDPGALSDALYRQFASVDQNLDYWKSLKAVSAAASLYRNLGIATIDVGVLERRLWESPWIPNVRSRFKAEHQKSAKFGSSALSASEIRFSHPLDLPSAFSCICFFESGRFHVQPMNLRNVMGMCSNDLIWVAFYLLDDPLNSESLSGLDGKSRYRTIGHCFSSTPHKADEETQQYPWVS